MQTTHTQHKNKNKTKNTKISIEAWHITLIIGLWGLGFVPIDSLNVLYFLFSSNMGFVVLAETGLLGTPWVARNLVREANAPVIKFLGATAKLPMLVSHFHCSWNYYEIETQKVSKTQPKKTN